ncbi:hypothetical protein [Glutamicibacter mishrai]|uniref:hypothetical protein n=1 Tax=Glutamicibacter mishrai TaxID=1775880 RepID=UPI003F79D829
MRSAGKPWSDPAEADAKVIVSPAIVLWLFLGEASSELSFNVLDDAAFKTTVLARLIKPNLKAQTVILNQQIDAPCPLLLTLFWSLLSLQQVGCRANYLLTG